MWEKESHNEKKTVFLQPLQFIWLCYLSGPITEKLSLRPCFELDSPHFTLSSLVSLLYTILFLISAHSYYIYFFHNWVFFFLSLSPFFLFSFFPFSHQFLFLDDLLFLHIYVYVCLYVYIFNASHLRESVRKIKLFLKF